MTDSKEGTTERRHSSATAGDGKEPVVENGGAPQPGGEGHDRPADAEADAAPGKAAKPGIMARLGLDPMTLTAMIKGGIAPVIGLAIYQSDAVMDQFTTLGYLIGIISVISMSVLPRGKFIQTLLLNVLSAGMGAAVALLMLWSALQARRHTETSPAERYNSSQAAVAAVWLFANIWLVNALRAHYPSLNVPSIIYSIMTNITSTYSPLITSDAAFEALVRRLLTAMLTAFAIATAVSLLVLPVSSRQVTAKQMGRAIGLLRGAVKQERAYLQSLERDDMFAVPADISAAVGVDDQQQPHPVATPEADAVKDTIFQLRQVMGKIYGDLPFAKRDVAWGKLESKDLTNTMHCLRAAVIPVVGMATLVDVFQRLAKKRAWSVTPDMASEDINEKNEEKRIWNEVMKRLHEPLEQLSEAIDEGLEHAGMVLEILPTPKSKSKSKSRDRDAEGSNADVESKGDLVRPGEPGFAETLRVKVNSFRVVRRDLLRTWAEEKGLMTDEMDFDQINAMPFPHDDPRHRRDQAQLYVLLYLETLLQAAGLATLEFVLFADRKVADGTMARNRLILPKFRTIRKWASSVFKDEDKSQEHGADLFDDGLAAVDIRADDFAQTKDPEHLPATTTWQRLGNAIRAFPRAISSPESQFGFRVACATLTIGIVAFLENTYQFFIQQRLIWAMIIISIGMTQTSGQSIFGFLCRIVGTVIAMVLALIAWYIVDGHTAGIFVFLYLFVGLTHYFLMKFPQFRPSVMICMVTQVMIIGYELQARRLGVAAAEANGQPYYPIYLLAPYRLAIVSGGCLVAFIWTVFPSPLTTERTQLRRDLAATLYLLAQYFSVVNESLRAQLAAGGGDGDGGKNDHDHYFYGDPLVKNTPAHRLAKHRRRLFGKLMLLLPALQQHADFQRWEPTVGGRFPRDLYQDIIRRAVRLNSYLTLLAHTIGGAGLPSLRLAGGGGGGGGISSSSSSSSSRDGGTSGVIPDRAWLDALGVLLADISPTQNGIICTLTLLSNSLQSGHSLPPHLAVPRPYELARQMELLSESAPNNAHAAVAVDSSEDGGEDGGGRPAEEKEEEEEEEQKKREKKKKKDEKKKKKRVTGLLDASNMTQAGYAEFAVLQVCSTLVCDDLEGLVESVSQLVGVVDFGFHGAGRQRRRGRLGLGSSASASYSYSNLDPAGTTNGAKAKAGAGGGRKGKRD
ncbi:hypothetical protein GGR56DRAFT_315860 [Xylariaceae sp. FL0804]|nr:hypothetical protein GGR56DRAFT_315860 [Xylariaceae sp. FL0804]